MSGVLVVDDEPAILKVIQAAIRDLGLEVIYAAPNAEAALRFLKSNRPGIIITDVRLPGMDGVELTRRVKADPVLARTPVLLISAYGEPRQHDGDGFLPKPFDIESLAAFVRRSVLHA